MMGYMYISIYSDNDILLTHVNSIRRTTTTQLVENDNATAFIKQSGSYLSTFFIQNERRDLDSQWRFAERVMPAI